MPNVVKINAKINTMQNINILFFCSFTVLNKLKALQLTYTVGLSTIKHQHSKKLTRWIEATWSKNTWKMQIVCKSLFTKMFKMFTVCTDTCLETLSSLVNCSVSNNLLQNQTIPQLSIPSVRYGQWTNKKQNIGILHGVNLCTYFNDIWQFLCLLDRW